MYVASVVFDDIPMYGKERGTLAAVRRVVPALENQARTDAKKAGWPASAYMITIVCHKRGCHGCENEFGLDDECRLIEERPVTEADPTTRTAGAR